MVKSNSLGEATWLFEHLAMASTPRTARYVRPLQVRAASAPGRARCAEASMQSLQLGHERWRTATARAVPTPRVEVAPLRLGAPGQWQGELWARSLRRPGVALQVRR